MFLKMNLDFFFRAKEKMFAQNIITIMDESGSMVDLGQEPVEAVNNFIDKQKNITENDGSTFTLWKFNTETKLEIDKISLNEMEQFSNFKPTGLTALFDAIGNAIDHQQEERNIICVIVTDGMENSSTKYNIETIKKKINKMETEYNWKFIYLGANQDAFATGAKIGFNVHRCNTFNAYEGIGGLLDTMNHINNDIHRFRSRSSEFPDQNNELILSQIQPPTQSPEESYINSPLPPPVRRVSRITSETIF